MYNRMVCIYIVGFTTSEITYQWVDSPKAVSIFPEVELPQFQIMGYRKRNYTYYLTTGYFSLAYILLLLLHFTRLNNKKKRRRSNMYVPFFFLIQAIIHDSLATSNSFAPWDTIWSRFTFHPAVWFITYLLFVFNSSLKCCMCSMQWLSSFLGFPSGWIETHLRPGFHSEWPPFSPWPLWCLRPMHSYRKSLTLNRLTSTLEPASLWSLLLFWVTFYLFLVFKLLL